MPVFAFTDIEGSTGLWEKHQDAMGPVIAKHYAILDHCVPAYGGKIIKKTGDGIFALFPDTSPDQPSQALECALELQRRFQAEAWPVIGELRVRMGFHRGRAEEMAGDYYGPTANRTARFMALGWGGQILVSEDLKKQARLPQGAEWMDLGVHQVKDLPEPQHVFSLAHPSLKLREFPALKSLSNRPHNLPQQLSAFVGRARELKEAAALLAGPHSRLVTLLGGGGMGKSRLAVQAALEALPLFKHGAAWVGLDPAAPAEAAPGRMAEALKLGLYRGAGPKEQVLDYLKDKQLLLVLDPCEGLGDGAGLISDILEACPGVRVLACSRRRLNLRGESVLALRGLDYPGPGSAEALDGCGCALLFTQEAQAVVPGFALKPEDRLFFLRLCRALQGMPLGLALAAGWLRQAPLKALAERVEKDPRFLASNGLDRPEAHRSLKALFDSAWTPLDAEERDALAQLCVFRGSFTLAGAQSVARARPEVLAALADQCLLEPGEAGRFSVPEATRAFAALKLEEAPQRRDHALDMHARYYCAFLKERERGLLGYGQARALAELRQEFPNLSRAWDRAVEKGWVREIGQAVRCLGLFTDMLGLARDWEPRMERAQRLWEGADNHSFEGLSWEEAMAALAGLHCVQANYLFGLGRGGEALERMSKSQALYKKCGQRSGAAYALVRFAVLLGPEDERRVPALEDAAALYQALGDANGVAYARRNLGYLLCRQGRAREGRPMVEESLAEFEKVGNLRELAWALNSLGQLDMEAGQVAAGERGLKKARDLFLGLGDLENAAWTLNSLGLASIRRRLWAEAKPAVEESLKLFGQIRHFRGRALALRILCDIHVGLGDLDSAFRAVEQIVIDARAAGDLGGQAGALMQKGKLMAKLGRFDEGLAVLQEAQAGFAKLGSALGQGQALEAQACAKLRQGHGSQARGLFLQAGEAFAQAGARDGEARAYVRLGDLDYAEGKNEGGEGSYLKALRLSRQGKLGDYSVGALLGLAGVMARQNRALEALQLGLLGERVLPLMPAPDAEFHDELEAKTVSVMAQLGSKLLRSVIDEAREKMAGKDARALLKEAVEKGGL